MQVSNKSCNFAGEIKIKKRTMARPIAETPVLSGNDAIRFEEAMNNVRPLSRSRRAAMDAEYKSFTSRVTVNI